MLFGYHYATGLGGRCYDGFLVQGLDGGDVDDLGADALGLQGLGGLQGLPNGVAGGDEGDILAFVHHDGLANDEGLVLIREVGNGGTAEAEVYRTYIFGNGQGGLEGLVVVAGIDDHHAGEGAHEGDVLHGLVSGSVLTQRNAGMGRGNLHIGVAVGQLLTDLVVYTAGDKFCEGTHERNLAGEGQAGGGANHVGLRDAALDEALRELCCEGVHLKGTLEICGEGHDILVGLACLQKARAETAAGVFLT